MRWRTADVRRRKRSGCGAGASAGSGHREPVERDAWLVGPSVNLREGRNELHVFDVARIEDGPVASWRADAVLPAGFHGVWAR
nr:carotenoid oxygenase family protein [uncultured Brevundimonas sp.]